MSTIFMKAIIQFRTNKPLEKPLSELGFEVGGFDFKLQHPETKELINLQFDFDAYSVSASPYTSSVTYESGHGLFFNDDTISEDFREHIKELNLSFDDINAKLLSSVTDIEEFHFAVTDSDYLNLAEVIVKEIIFSDNITSYPVCNEVIAAYNQHIQKKLNSQNLNEKSEKTIENFCDEINLFEVHDENNFATCVWMAFDNAYELDDERTERKFRHIYNSYINADEAGKKLIDDVLMSLCGYSLLSLLNRGEEIYTGQDEEE